VPQVRRKTANQKRLHLTANAAQRSHVAPTSGISPCSFPQSPMSSHQIAILPLITSAGRGVAASTPVTILKCCLLPLSETLEAPPKCKCTPRKGYESHSLLPRHDGAGRDLPDPPESLSKFSNVRGRDDRQGYHFPPKNDRPLSGALHLLTAIYLACLATLRSLRIGCSCTVVSQKQVSDSS
jgi:hypothetical protein